MSVPRLKKRKEFVRIAGSGGRWVSPSLVLQIAPRPETESGVRVGFTASKKVGNAVKRNRAKRRLREAVERILPENALDGYDYVLIARSAAIDCPYEQLLNDLQFCLSGVHRNLFLSKPDALKQ